MGNPEQDERDSGMKANTVSVDGKTITTTTKGMNRAGKNVNCTNVMDKQ